MLVPFSAGAIWICALQPLLSKPQQEVMLPALLPGSHSLPVYLSSAGITLQTHFLYAACFWSFAVRLQVCV